MRNEILNLDNLTRLISRKKEILLSHDNKILQNIFYCRTIVQSHGSKNSHGSTQRNEFIQTLNNKLFTGSSKEFGYNTFDDRPTIF